MGRPATGRAPESRAHPPERAPESRAVQSERLQRGLARAGLGSRRGVEDLIREGRVRIGGRTARLGDRVDPSSDRVTVDGVPVPLDPDLRYLAVNKPAGVTTTMRDAHASRTIADLLPPGPRLFPVGRLDRDTEGLVLLTNDGELAHRLQHPRYGIEKEYLAEVEGSPGRAAVVALETGIRLDDGMARAVRASIVGRRGDRSALRVVMAEGRKREVRRMLEAVGHPVRRLVRVRVGPIRLGRLRPGAARPLENDEVTSLYRSTGLGEASVTARRREPSP